MKENEMHGDLMMSVDGGPLVPVSVLEDVTLTFNTPHPQKLAVVSNGEFEKMMEGSGKLTEGFRKLSTACEMTIECARINARAIRQLTGRDTNNDRKRWHIPKRSRYRLSSKRDRWSYERQLWSLRKKWKHNYPIHFGYFWRWDA